MKEKILLVEDNETIVLGLDYLLKEENFNLKVAKTKKEVYEKLKQNQFDLVLLDITLPDGDGFEICKFIKENFQSVPVIFLTAKEEEKDVVKGLDIGAEDYIIKPFRNRELISRIKNVLRRNRTKTNFLSCKNIKINVESRKSI